MNYISWNCQGLGKPLTVQTLREVTRSHSPAFVFLSETHQSYHFVDKVRRQFGYSKGFNVEPIETAGGLSLWWKPEFSVSILDYSMHFVDTVVTKTGSSRFRITWLYGPPYFADKEKFWDSWNSKNWNDGTPWLVIGDLNELISQHEKEGRATWGLNRKHFLRCFQNTNKLIDIPRAEFHLGKEGGWCNCAARKIG
ncbi:putative endonuclease/exonuclease/phosphatase [Rosa chinensis]|uniref:Putative endonuclease/exonuclease/phosphatase n=1 Tax=Rosa chinensis TaxID=74649 RepID=A0A2P6SJT3_ROSCH|nr:putative endonuclease/exonuclease/phosphatase [Rosa chinensis]